MKMHPVSLIWAALLSTVIFLVPCLAQEATDRFDRIRESFSRVKSIRTDFVQEKRMKILARPLVSEGSFQYRAPADIRWEYRNPIRSVLMMDNGDVKRYTWNGSAWVEDRGAGLEAMRFVLQDISGWVSGEFGSSSHFRAELKEGDPVRVTLIPRDPSIGSFIQQVVLTLSPQPGVLKSVEIVEGPGSSTLIELRNTVVNVSFPEDLFRKAP